MPLNPHPCSFSTCPSLLVASFNFSLLSFRNSYNKSLHNFHKCHILFTKLIRFSKKITDLFLHLLGNSSHFMTVRYEVVPHYYSTYFHHGFLRSLLIFSLTRHPYDLQVFCVSLIYPFY